MTAFAVGVVHEGTVGGNETDDVVTLCQQFSKVGSTFLQGCRGVLELEGQKLPPRGSPASYTRACTVKGRAGMIVSGASSISL